MGDEEETTYGMNGGVLENVNPGKRVRGLMNRDGDRDMSQMASMNTPENPGPSIAGRTPVIGMMRRERGLPVVRDQLPDLVDY